MEFDKFGIDKFGIDKFGIDKFEFDKIGLHAVTHVLIFSINKSQILISKSVIVKNFSNGLFDGF
jgi:hypothetical protein